MTERSLSIIVPAYNESGNLPGAVDGIFRAASLAGLSTSYEVIVVDDGSTDGTLEVAHYLEQLWPRLRVLSYPVNLGLRAAYETGLAAAQYEYVAWAPGDGEIAVESLLDIFRAVGQADIVIPYHGTPERRPWFRRFLTWFSTWQINVLLGHRLRYWQGPCVYRTEVARALPRTVDGFFFAAEMLAAAKSMGFSHVEVPLVHQERAYGVSKAVSWKRIWQAQCAVIGFWWRFRIVGEHRRDVGRKAVTT